MSLHLSATRMESDSIGTKEVPADAYYGVQSLRGMENFPITGSRMNPQMINSLATLKKACAIANAQAGVLDEAVKDAICEACDLILSGNYHDAFIVDPIQGGAGTSMNMNANEVIANIAIERLGGTAGGLHPCPSQRPCQLRPVHQRRHPHRREDDLPGPFTDAGRSPHRPL